MGLGTRLCQRTSSQSWCLRCLAVSVPPQPTAYRVRPLQPGKPTCPVQGSTAGHPWSIILSNSILPDAYTASGGYFTDAAKPNPHALGFARAARNVLTPDTWQVPMESLTRPCSMRCQGWTRHGSHLGPQRYRGLLGTVAGLWQRVAGRDRAGQQWRYFWASPKLLFHWGYMQRWVTVSEVAEKHFCVPGRHKNLLI